ncbi:MAG: hypothetical protein IPG71_04155 [bacterium]|nr:hypothetical protein [bacterium]
MPIVFVLLCASLLCAQTTTIGDYKFTQSPTRDGLMQQLVVMKKDKHMWDVSDYVVRVLDADSLGLPNDLTGDHVRDVVIETYSGGAHCCYAQYVLSLGYNFEVLDTIEHAGTWADRDDDGLWDVTAGDLTLDYWKLPHSDSPLPTVVLEASREGFVPAPELMHKPEPTAHELLALIHDVQSANEWRDYNAQSESEFMSASHAVLHRTLVEMIYTGNAEIGLEIVAALWPPVIKGRQEYILDLREELAKSPYNGALAELNKGTVFGE